MLHKIKKNAFETKISRRSFLKGCAIATAAMGLPTEMIEKVAEAIASPKRPSVIWLHLMECTGCSETLLRSSHPDAARLLLDLISLDYHETLMTAAGHQAEQVLAEMVAANEDKFICVVEGAIPTKDGGVYCKIGGRSALEILQHVVPKAKQVVAIGTCASYGGIQAAQPNPTGAVGVKDLMNGRTIINVPGCPPNPNNILGTILHLLTFGRTPELDEFGRPKFAYGRKIHDHCERRPHFDEGRFVERFGDPGHQKGYCLYKVGCKGPVTYSNCPVIRFCDVGTWPVGSGHGCIGCTEPKFWDNMSPFYKHLPEIYIPAGGGIRSEAEYLGKAALVGAGALVATHALAGVVKKTFISKKEQPSKKKEKNEKKE